MLKVTFFEENEVPFIKILQDSIFILFVCLLLDILLKNISLIYGDVNLDICSESRFNSLHQ